MSIITKKSQQPSVVVHLQVPGNTRKIKIPKICMKLIPCFKKYTKNVFIGNQTNERKNKAKV